MHPPYMSVRYGPGHLDIPRKVKSGVKGSVIQSIGDTNPIPSRCSIHTTTAAILNIGQHKLKFILSSSVQVPFLLTGLSFKYLIKIDPPLWVRGRGNSMKRSIFL